MPHRSDMQLGERESLLATLQTYSVKMGKNHWTVANGLGMFTKLLSKSPPRDSIAWPGFQEARASTGRNLEKNNLHAHQGHENQCSATSTEMTFLRSGFERCTPLPCFQAASFFFARKIRPFWCELGGAFSRSELSTQ